MLPQVTISRELQVVASKHDPAVLWDDQSEKDKAPEFVPARHAGVDTFSFKPLSFREFAVIETAPMAKLHLALETALKGCSIGGAIYEGAAAYEAMQNLLSPSLCCDLARHILTASGGDLDARRFR